jgi:hypothetical protein
LKEHVESTTKQTVHLIPADLEKTEEVAKAVKSHIDKVSNEILPNDISMLMSADSLVGSISWSTMRRSKSCVKTLQNSMSVLCSFEYLPEMETEDDIGRPS